MLWVIISSWGLITLLIGGVWDLIVMGASSVGVWTGYILVTINLRAGKMLKR